MVECDSFDEFRKWLCELDTGNMLVPPQESDIPFDGMRDNCKFDKENRILHYTGPEIDLDDFKVDSDPDQREEDYIDESHLDALKMVDEICGYDY